MSYNKNELKTFVCMHINTLKDTTKNNINVVRITV